MTGRASGKRTALAVLADEGYITRTKTSRGYEIESIRLYEQADDHPSVAPDETSSTSSRPRPFARVNP